MVYAIGEMDLVLENRILWNLVLKATISWKKRLEICVLKVLSPAIEI